MFMNANGQRFWMLSDNTHWQLLGDPSGVEYNEARRSLRLAGQRREITFAEEETIAHDRLKFVPRTLDSYGNLALWDRDEKSVIARGAMEGDVTIYTPEPGMEDPTDIAMGYDGVLYIAINGQVFMHDRRERWEDATVSESGFVAWRIAADPAGGVWVLDKDNRQLGRVSGQPLPRRPFSPYEPDVSRPCRENANPPKLSVLGDVSWRQQEEPVALACSPFGALAFLSWSESGAAYIRCLDQNGSLTSPLELLGVKRPYSISWVTKNRVALLLASAAAEAPVYRLDTLQKSQWPAGELYPLKKDYIGGPFLHGLEMPPHYPAGKGSRALHRLSFPFFTKHGEAVNYTLAAPMDSGNPQMTWHRLYLEGVIPAACGIRIWLGAADEAGPPYGLVKSNDFGSSELVQRLLDEKVIQTAGGDPDHVLFDSSIKNEIRLMKLIKNLKKVEIERVLDIWRKSNISLYEHRFGKIFEQGARSEIPLGAWEAFPSEVPHHPGLLPCNPEPDKAGLFTVMIQRSGHRVRSLSGRYLHVHVELTGNGHTTPEIFAVRAYGSRFSYIEEYLPRFYRETTFPPEADEGGSATSADFLERFVGNVEGVLSNMEDRIAQSYLLTHPQTVPEDSLEWLGSWIGVDLQHGLPEKRRRQLLQAAPEQYRWHGTLRGLKLALEIATGGGISGGEIVVLEDFRLRRTFATIIGADLDDKGAVTTSDFKNERLVARLLEEKIITEDRNMHGYFCFDLRIKDEIELSERLKQAGIRETGPLLAVWRKARQGDPLTLGGAVSGNSYVGDTLFLGDENKKEFLALFSADLPADMSEQAAIENLFDRLAYRVTILVHEEVEAQDLGLILNIAEQEAPAHVEVRVLPASQPFLVGMASLVGVDTYLAKRIPAKPVRIGTSYIGRRDYVQGPSALDPRLEGVGSGVPQTGVLRPIAIAPDTTAGYGESVTLDGSESRAFEGRDLTGYKWEFKGEER
jgi:phage tail-like protein